MVPIQDTCECKATYKAVVRCPAELTPLMSAVKTSGPDPCPEPEWETPEGCGKAWASHSFDQAVPIPAYLIAIVCGKLASRRVGPRTQIWSEDEMVEEPTSAGANRDARMCDARLAHVVRRCALPHHEYCAH